MKKIVYVDMDNVLVDFKTGISRIITNVRQLHPVYSAVGKPIGLER